MGINPLAAGAVAIVFAAAGAVAAPGRVEHWTATSTTAMGITGDIALSPSRLTAAGRTFPLAVAADVKGFVTDQGPKAVRILRVTRPANPVLLHGNRLCSGPVRWLSVYRGADGDLGMAVFEGADRPTKEDVPGLCGTFLYSRPR